MKKIIMMLMAALLVAACATLTPEQKAARDAAIKEGVKSAVASQKFKINVTSVTPMRGTNRSLSGAFIKLDSTTVECFLPYAGRDDIPHMKTRGEMRMTSKIEIRGEVRDYLMGIDPADERAVVSFTASDLGVDYKFTITIENTGSAKIHVDPDKRDYIDYEGYVVVKK